MNENDPDHVTFAAQLLDSMVSQVDELANQAACDLSNTQNFLLKVKFQEISELLKVRLDLVAVLWQG